MPELAPAGPCAASQPRQLGVRGLNYAALQGRSPDGQGTLRSSSADRSDSQLIPALLGRETAGLLAFKYVESKLSPENLLCC